MRIVFVRFVMVMIITFVYWLPIFCEIFQREIKEFVSSKIFVGPYKINPCLQITMRQFILKHSIIFSYYELQSQTYLLTEVLLPLGV